MVYEPFAAGETVTAEKLRTRIIEIVMDWTPLSELGTFQTGFAPNAAMAPAMQIRRVMGTLEWLYQGRVTNSGPINMVNVTANVFQFTSTAHRPIVERGDHKYAASSGHYSVRLGLQPSGMLTASVPAAGATPGSFWLDGFVITNPR
ncbi:hypothetical protein [Streptomyces roseolus]|uniref:hypothetical protein n=1 Tax=Streptomyces roseolus TaxID=67358 RepID=UPI0036C9168E